MDILGQDIKFLPGVGPNRKKMLSDELGIETYGDLLEYYPYKYVDRSKVYTIHELTGDMPYIQVVGHILSFETFPMGQRKERVVAHFTDGTAICDLIWFNGGKYAKQTYRIGTEYVVFGKPTVFNNRINFTHPDLDDASKVDLSSMGLQPYYNTTEKMKKMSDVRSLVSRATGYGAIPVKKLLLASPLAGSIYDENNNSAGILETLTARVRPLGPLAGLAMYGIEDDYYSPDGNYLTIRSTINELNK